MSVIGDGASFSWSFDGFSSPDPQGSINEICKPNDRSRIGYHTQVFLSRAFITEGMKITYIQSDGEIKIYY